MFRAPVISKPVFQQKYNNTNPEKWNSILKTWNDKNYTHSVLQLLEYLGVNTQNFTNQISIPHGSIVIHLKITDDCLYIHAPFLDIEDSLKLPLFRQVLQINYSPLRLSQIYLSKNQLSFRSEIPLALCYPPKILDVLKEICIHADLYDDTFIRKYRAKRIASPIVIPLEKNLQTKGIQLFRDIIKDTEYTLQYLLKERRNDLIWDCFVCMLLKIDYSLAPNGHLKSDIEKWLLELHSQIELSEKINIGNKALRFLHQLSDLQIQEDLYQIYTFVPLKEWISNESLKNQLQQISLQIQKEYQKTDYVAAYFTTIYQTLMIAYQYELDTVGRSIVQNILGNTNGDIYDKKIQEIKLMLHEIIQNLNASSQYTDSFPSSYLTALHS